MEAESADETPVGEASMYVGLDDFARAIDKIQPSVSRVQRRRYEALRSKFAGLPVRGGKVDEDKISDEDPAHAPSS